MFISVNGNWRQNFTHKIFVVFFKSVAKFMQHIKTDLIILKMAASRRVSMIPQSRISFKISG